jgi:hypothetical protein
MQLLRESACCQELDYVVSLAAIGWNPITNEPIITLSNTGVYPSVVQIASYSYSSWS